jgi:DNA-binding NtrC family response regulator
LRFLDNKLITPIGSGKSRQLDLQLILASNQNIPQLIKEKRFREDLYQRINQIRIELSPLRDRVEDIPILINHFFRRFKEKEKTKLVSIEPKVKQILSTYAWPGNIRELQFVIWDACTKARLFGDTILQTKYLKHEIIKPSNPIITQSGLNDSIGNQEKIVILELQSINSALQKSFGHKAIAAEMLGINADQLRYKVLKLKNENPEIIGRYINITKAYKIET